MQAVEEPKEVEGLKEYFENKNSNKENQEKEGENGEINDENNIDTEAHPNLLRNTSMEEILDAEKKRIDKFMEKKLKLHEQEANQEDL